MKKYESPELEVISFISKESITADILDGSYAGEVMPDLFKEE